MERDTETGKLMNVLRRIARAATHAAWTRNAEAARFCVTQYNKVLARLTELEPAVATLFTTLPETSSPDVTRIAAHELAAYFDDEPAEDSPRVRVRFRGCGGRAWAGAVRVGSCR
ncbi:MAG TPA: hypothetical protein VN937_25875 [Blastocatellia bacterium]|nr:hypothetical protein [Blastocatellia bacterium]